MSDLAPEGWSTSHLNEVIKQLIDFRGRTPKKLGMEWGNGNIRALSANNVQMGKVNFNKECYLASEDLYQKWMTKGYTEKGDVLFTMEAPLGNVALVPDDAKYILSQRVILLKAVKEKMLPEFLFQQLRSDSFQDVLRENATGSTALGIQQKRLVKLDIIIPPLPEQQKIAAILTSVDEVIEKTQAQIDKLKDLKIGMMQTLLTNGVGIDGKPHTEFKDSPVGRIPKGWEALPLSKVAKLERGKFSHRPRNDPAFYNGDIPFLQTGDIPKKSPYIQKFSQTLNQKGLSVSKSFPIGTLVITIAATIGEIGILEFESCFPDSLVGIKVNSKKADSMYVLYVMRHLKGELDLLAPQTAQKNINLDILNPFSIPVPPLFEQVQISKALESVDSRLNILGGKLTTIQNTKKALMQDLLTGKVRVNVSSEKSGH